MVRGSCLCGGVRFELAEVPLIALCHCSMCRKANGSAFEAGAAVPSSSVRLTAGQDLIQQYESSPGTRRNFCRVCGSRVPSQSKDGRIHFVPAGLLDDDPGVRPALHMFVGSKAPWWEITDDLPRFEEWVPGYGPDGPD
ncbi:MAG: GFA family protein [Myxococcota bacterium]